MTRRRMQRHTGRIGPLVLVAAVAASLTACDLPANDDTADYAQVCTDAAGNAEPDSDCDGADGDYQGETYVAGRSYMWRYYRASNLVIPAYGQRMPSGGSVRRPTVAATGGTSGSSSGAGTKPRPATIATPSAGQSGGTLTTTGGSSSIQRGGFGVKAGGAGTKGGTSGSSSSSSSGGASGKGGSGSAGS